jgi:hypothetical protein
MMEKIQNEILFYKKLKENSTKIIKVTGSKPRK